MRSLLQRLAFVLTAACADAESAPPAQQQQQQAPAAVEPAMPAMRAMPAMSPNSASPAPTAGVVASAPVHDDADSGRPPPETENQTDTDAAAPSDSAPDRALCPDGYPRGQASMGARKLLGVKPSPEGVTVCPNGGIFLSLDDGRIARLSPDGQQLEPWAELLGLQPAGITCDEQDRLFVAIYSVRSGGSAVGVVRVDAQGSAAVALPAPRQASPLAAYNGILAVAGHGVYATDSGAGWVVRFHEDAASPGRYTSEIVARDIPIANGLAYDTARRKLYVASSLDFAIYAFDVSDDGSLGTRSKVMTTSASFFDGVAVDEEGTVYVADYSGGVLVRLRDTATLAKLPTPASLAFRGGTLFVTDYRLNQPDAEGGLYSIELGLCSGQLQRAQP